MDLANSVREGVAKAWWRAFRARPMGGPHSGIYNTWMAGGTKGGASQEAGSRPDHIGGKVGPASLQRGVDVLYLREGSCPKDLNTGLCEASKYLVPRRFFRGAGVLWQWAGPCVVSLGRDNGLNSTTRSRPPGAAGEGCRKTGLNMIIYND
eukprot:scaffold8283_cov19-Prasinocladus_malaysianus.AAC.1